MRTIYQIARQELSVLFCSPVAWLVLIVFPIQIGMDYATFMLMLGRASRMGQTLTDITTIIFTTKDGFYFGVKNTLYFYIPLLTMGLIARETHSGTIKLLLSSPIKVIDIVLGKYLAMAVYGFILLIIICLMAFSGSFFIKNIDFGLVISGALGLYLLICAYAAIGLFMSSLTSYQVVAAISTFAVLGLLNFIGGLFQGNDLVRHLTYFLSISGRTEQYISGLISTEDLLYFLLIIFFFLGLTVMRLQQSRKVNTPSKKLMQFAAFFLICFTIGYASSRPSLTGYIDMTATKSQTLSDSSKVLIHKMDKPLEITTYVNIMDNNYYMGAPETKSADEKMFLQYRRFMPDLKMSYVYYYDVADNKNLDRSSGGLSLEQKAKKVADIKNFDFKKLLNPAQIRAIVDLKPEENRLVRQLNYGGRKTFLRYYDDFMRFPSEQEISAAIKRIVLPATVPVVTFIVGNGERSISKAGDSEYKQAVADLSFRYALINQGFDVDTIDINKTNISGRTTILVIADPKDQFSATALEKIKKYKDGGGNMLLTTEAANGTVTLPLLKDLGLALGSKPELEPSNDFAPDFILASVSNDAAEFAPRYQTLKAEGGLISMPNVAELKIFDPMGFKAVAVLNTKNKAAFAFALSREIKHKQQKIMVVGDADFMSTVELSRRTPVVRNLPLVTEFFSWLSNREFPVKAGGLKSKDVIDSGDNGIAVFRIIFFGILPIGLLIAATILLLYRKRR